jgi:hypothetical protein
MLGTVYADIDTIAETLISNLINSSNIAQINGFYYFTLDSSDYVLKFAQNENSWNTINFKDFSQSL